MGRSAVTASLFALAAAAVGGAALAQDGGPQYAHPGECYGRARLPGPTHVWNERVEVSRGGVARRVIPARYGFSQHRVLARPAWTETIRTPAVYRTEVERVTEPGRPYYVATPARYRQVVERVMVAPARLEWVRRSAAMAYGTGAPGAQTLIPTGEVMCRVRVPARYETRVHEVMATPSGRRRVEGPPHVRCIPHRVLVRPAGETHRLHPAEYRMEQSRVLLAPARVVTERYGPRFRTVEHVRGGDRDGWARVLCPTGLASWAMQRMQDSLNRQGYDAGPADGVGKPQTYQALQRFQHDHRMATGPITAESAQALGVTP